MFEEVVVDMFFEGCIGEMVVMLEVNVGLVVVSFIVVCVVFQ